MSRSLDGLGPIDWLVIEFPSGSIENGIASAIAALAEQDIIRVLDLVVIRRAPNGDLDCLEVGDLAPEELGGFGELAGHLRLLSSDDISAISQAVQPGAMAACLVWENTWAVAVMSTLRRRGGEVACGGRVSTQALLAAIEVDLALVDPDGEGTAVPQPPERIILPPLIGPPPVIRSTSSPAIAAVIAHGINRRLTHPGGRGC